MAVVYHEIYLPIDTESTFDYIVIKQGDAGTHKVRATLISNNRVYTIPTSGASYFMKFRKPDNNYCLVEATVSDNTISAEVTEEMLRVSGTGRGEFMIVSGSNELKTATFHVKIVKETFTSGDVQSHSDFAPFAALLQGAGAAASNANTAAAAANAAASLAEQKAQAIPDDYSDLVAEVEEVKADLDALEPGLSDTAKAALLACFDNVAWDGDDPTGQTYITALENALYGASARLSAVFTPGTEKYYPFDSLNSLKEHLVVRYKNDQDQTSVVTNYTLSGTLAVGAARIAVSYNGEVTHFNVNVEALEIANNRAAGVEQEADTEKLYAVLGESEITARCRIAAPIKNRSYTIAVADDTKYNVAGYDLLNNALVTSHTASGREFTGYEMNVSTLPSWATSWHVTGNYIFCTFKKLDGTDFTASEIENAYGTIYTVS